MEIGLKRWVAALLVKHRTGGLTLPQVGEKLDVDVQNHSHIMDALRTEHKIDVHAELGIDTWGNYTGINSSEK